MKKTLTWIVVADHQRAQIYEHEGPGKGIAPVEGLAFETHIPPDRDIVSDRPGRGFESGSTTRHGIEPRSDPHRAEGRHFVEHVVAALDEADKRGAYDRLVVIAPPRALGEFREALPDKLRAKVIGELDQDLTKLPQDGLVDHLGAFIAV